ncbi:hypothetical protein AB0F68_14190 [Micromonospora sp. NPDC023966]
MRATVIHGPNDVRVEEVPDAAVRTDLEVTSGRSDPLRGCGSNLPG